MLALSGLAQTAIAALPSKPGPLPTVAIFNDLSWHPTWSAFGVRIAGGGATIQKGIKGYLVVPFDCTIQSVTLLADKVGSAKVDIRKGPLASFPTWPSVTAQTQPALASQRSNQDFALFGWTTTLAKGDLLSFEVLSAAVITSLTIELSVQRT